VHQTPLEKRLQDLLEPEIQALGFECIEVSFASEGGRRILRVLIDAASGVGLEECARTSRALGALLDGQPEGPERYTLEVSSPGINRPLTKPEHFQRFLGERAKLRLTAPLDGGLAVTGVLRGLEGDDLLIETTVGTKRVPLDQIARARLHRDVDAILRAANARSAAPDSGAGARRWKR
jgi:ribosome maturation factor RimP